MLDEIRRQVAPAAEDYDDREFKRGFWAEFNEWLGEQEALVEAFGDPSDRSDVERGWSDYKGDLTGCHISVRMSRKAGWVGTGPWLYGRQHYKELYDLRQEIEQDLAGEGVSFGWSWPNGKKKNPEAFVYRQCDLNGDDLTETFAWIGHAMLRMRAYALRAGL